jgi:hypothetical protein
MQVRELIDLAAFAAAQGPMLLSSARQVPETALAQYWTVSKCRLDRWNRDLRLAQTPAFSNRGEPSSAARKLQTVCEEILISEMLTRVWTSLLTAVDYLVGSSEAQPVAANVLAGQLEASNRVLGIISCHQYAASGPGYELNRLRRLTERWTDLLLGSLGSAVRMADFAHDAARAEEFSHNFNDSGQPGVRKRAWSLVAASLQETFEPFLQSVTPNADLNSRIAGAILACFPVEVFDSTGIYHSLWNLRISTMTADAQQLVDELIAEDSASSTAGNS